jgi:Flp pilus assembly protein TadD/opacity protein-like surface antigen
MPYKTDVVAGARKRWLGAALGVFAVCAFAPPLAAQGQDEAAARSLFAEGRRLTREGHYAAACTRFEAASKLFTSAGVLVNLADCYEKVGRTEDARLTFGEAARVATRTNRPEVARDAASRQSRLDVQTPSASPMTQAEQAARVLFEEGRRLAGGGQFALACEKFEEARTLYSSAGVLANLADCYEKIGRPASAWTAFGEAAAIATRAGRADDAAAAKRRQGLLESRLGRLTIQASHLVDGLTVKLDGGDVSRDTWGTAIPVDPGIHEIRAQAPGYEPWTASLNAAQGQPVSADVPELHATAPGPSETVTTIDGAAAGQPGAQGAPAGVSKLPEKPEREGLDAEWVWMRADVGGAYANLTSLDASNLSLRKTATGGPAFGMGAGLRLAFLTLGASGRELQLSDFNLWEINAEVGLHIRIDRVDPYLGVRGGYAFVDSVNSDAARSTAGTSQSSATGFNVGLLLGVDYYFSHWVSVGVDANPEFLLLHRPPLPLPPGVSPETLSLSPDQQALYQQSGSSIGFGFASAARLGVHF